ncbi:MAG: aminoacyl-tRNA hydrolase [Puniceicoccales bacterium]|nr:aminoacyl-tRNA hydrolase [Puniceicoccales bacterium]
MNVDTFEENVSKSIRLIVGVGNPGIHYVNTRHNIGFYLLDEVAQSNACAWQFNRVWQAYTTSIVLNNTKIWLLKPQMFMNLSGFSVRAACHYLKLEPSHLLIVCDDISIEFGKFKISTLPGSAGHKGIQNISQCLGSGFTRYRMGVGGKKNTDMTLSTFVLSKFTPEEQSYLPFILQKFKKNLEVLIDKGIVKGMNFIER